jgi:predicted MFS family arabinose efflux permease
MIQITCYSIITQMFADDIMKYLSYLEICAGFGGTIGNLLAGILYEKIDYMYTMVVFWAIMFLAYLVSLALIPNELN